MRLFAIVLLCLVLATCASHIPSARVTHPANAGLPGLQGFQLMPPEQAVDALPYRNRYPLINAELRQGLAAHGYHESATPQFRVYYWLALRDAPLEFRPDLPPTSGMGPYLAIHRLRDETGTLRVRLVDLEERVLWEGMVSTGLSPARAIRNSSNWRSAPCSGCFHAPARTPWGRLPPITRRIPMQIYKVGGAVRDRLLGRPVTDIDWVVVGASSDEMLARGYRPVGADFPVFLHPQSGEEYALARTERKSGRGYGGFTFHASPEVTLEEDLTRRDLTINAMAEDEQGRVIDPYGGQADLEARLLRHVSPAFAEDPLRVLRVARFAARYAGLGFRIAAETLALMRQLAESGELQALTPERSWKEISRALMEPNPEVFIQVLHDCGALAELIPEVEALFGVPQPAAHHPEIDTGVHVLSVLQQCARHRQPLSVRWACLLHDLGKGLTSEADWPRHIAHEARGVPLIDAVNQRFRVPRDCQELARLVGEYHTHAHRALELRPNTLLELLQSFDVYRRPQRFEEFVAASEMDARGRLGLEQRDYPQAAYLLGAAQAARAVSVKPLVEKGLKGAELGEALKRARLAALKAYKEERGKA